MKNEDRDQRIVQSVTERLDASLREIDERSLERLRRARLAALDGRPRESGVFGPRRFQLTPAVLSFAALAFLVVTVFALLPGRAPRSLTADDLEVITSKEQVAMLEDLDFYRWLAVTDGTRVQREPGR